jgi:hypothetical protein
VRLANTRTSTWLAPASYFIGGVCLTSRLLAADGQIIEPHYATWRVFDHAVEPGASLEVEVDIPVPPHAGLKLDLHMVSHGVAHFDSPDSPPFVIAFDDIG